MRRFFLTHQKQQTLSVKLTWSQYVDLMGIDNEAKRSFYAHEAANCGWDVRELRRQIGSMLIELKTTPLTRAAGSLGSASPPSTSYSTLTSEHGARVVSRIWRMTPTSSLDA